MPGWNGYRLSTRDFEGRTFFGVMVRWTIWGSVGNCKMMGGVKRFYLIWIEIAYVWADALHILSTVDMNKGTVEVNVEFEVCKGVG